MNITKLIFASLGALIIIMLLKRINNEFAFFASCVVNIVITVFSVAVLVPVFDYINSLSDSDIYSLFIRIMFKSAAVCLMSSFAADLCRDAGESSLASKIEFSAKCTLLTFCLPLLQKVFEYAKTFIS